MRMHSRMQDKFTLVGGREVLFILPTSKAKLDRIGPNRPVHTKQEASSSRTRHQVNGETRRSCITHRNRSAQQPRKPTRQKCVTGRMNELQGLALIHQRPAPRRGQPRFNTSFAVVFAHEPESRSEDARQQEEEEEEKLKRFEAHRRV